MKNLLRKAAALLMIPALIFMLITPFAALTAVEEGVIYVSEEAVDSYGFRWAVQDALDQARYSATDDTPYTVYVPEGEYSLSGVLRIYDNTTLNLSGVTLIRSATGNMLRVGDEDTVNSGAQGYYYRNIRVVGGTFDGDYGNNTIIKAFHTQNFTMIDVTVRNEAEGHAMEFAGVDGLTIRGCVFENQLLTPGNNGYEVIQLDVLHSYHITNGRSEDLPMKNVLIEYCTFDQVPRAIGSHTAVHNLPHDHIVIRHNVFTNLGSIAIQGLNWTNVDISSNVITDAPRGITLYAEPDGRTYLPSKLASNGNTQSHASDSYIAPAKANINIAYNVLGNIGTTDDPYASYSSQGIAVLGKKLTAKSAVNGTDESGGLPAGDYYIDGVDIHDNFIDIRGSGVRVEDARGVTVKSNEILCSENTVHSDNYYGIVLRNNVTASEVGYNTVMNAEINGIQLDGTKGGSVDLVKYNRIEDSGKYGIGAYAMTLGKVTNNDILRTANYGLFLGDSTTAAEVRLNRIRNCSKQGIWITSNSAASLVENNTTVNCPGSNSYGGSTVKTNYSGSAALKGFNIPWLLKPTRYGATMGVGAMFKIVPDVSPANAFNGFTYSSSDSDTVMVDDNGMVYALREGSAVITVRSDNNITKTYTVAVEGDGGVTHLEQAPDAPVLLLGDADGNGAVEAIDVTTLQRTLAYIDTPGSVWSLLRGDVDGSDDLELTDVTCIQRYLAGMPTGYPIGEPIS